MKKLRLSRIREILCQTSLVWLFAAFLVGNACSERITKKGAKCPHTPSVILKKTAVPGEAKKRGGLAIPPGVGHIRNEI
jgi:hypothetical protein